MGEHERIVVADAIEAAAFEDMYAAMPAPLSRSLGVRVARSADATLLMAPGLPVGMFNRAIGLGTTRAATERDVDDVIAAFERESCRTFWIHASEATEPAHLSAWLEARGFTRASRPRWAKVLRGTVAPPLPPARGLVVHPASSNDAASLASVLVAAHAIPLAMAPWLEALVGRPRWRAYATFDGAELVGGGMSFQDGARAWLGLGGTRADRRGRGGQKALMSLRVADAIAAGATTLATETGEPIGDEPNPSLANMYWCGFEKVSSRENWARSAT